MFSRKKKKDKNDDLSQPGVPSVEEGELSPSHSPMLALQRQDRTTVAKEKPKGTGSMARDREDSRWQEGTQLEVSGGSPHGRGQSSPRLTRQKPQPSPSGASIEDRGYNTEESSSSLPDAHYPRKWSSASTASASSYHTASSSLPHDLSPISSALLQEREATAPFSSMKDELLKSVREIAQEEMTQLERTIEQKYEARMEKMEKQMELIQNVIQNLAEAAVTANERGGVSPRRLPPLKEVREENFDGGGEGLDSRYREKLNFTVSCYVL
jgi:hypothetical protein